MPQVFNLENATNLGGLNHLNRFLGKLGLDGKLKRAFRTGKAPWATWPLDRIVRVLLDVSFAGLPRLYHFEDLETEPLLCHQHGVDRLPDLKTLYRDLRRFEDPALLGGLHRVNREQILERLAREKIAVLEIDSTVETLRGQQEGAEVGYNPHKPGRPSYHPLLARDRITDLVVHHVLRPGDAGTATGIVPFLHQTLDTVRQADPHRPILARLDSGFEGEPVLALLERRRVGYVVKMRATADLAASVYGLSSRAWKRLQVEGEGETQVASFPWLRGSWSRRRRIVVLRKRGQEEPQGRLFDALGCSYSFFVTDRNWAPEEVVFFYDKRADAERTVCELKNDLSIDHVPTASFGANAADLAIKVLARNLLVLYRDIELRLAVRERVMTLRRRYIYIAGRIIHHAGRALLRLSVLSPLREILVESG